MTLKELLDKVSELCNDDTKDLPVTTYNNEHSENVEITEINVIFGHFDARSNSTQKMVEFS